MSGQKKKTQKKFFEGQVQVIDKIQLYDYNLYEDVVHETKVQPDNITIVFNDKVRNFNFVIEGETYILNTEQFKKLLILAGAKKEG